MRSRSLPTHSSTSEPDPSWISWRAAVNRAATSGSSKRTTSPPRWRASSTPASSKHSRIVATSHASPPDCVNACVRSAA